MVMSDGERWIALQNIANWEEQLKVEQNGTQRRILRELIDQERDKLPGKKHLSELDSSGGAEKPDLGLVRKERAMDSGEQ